MSLIDVYYKTILDLINLLVLKMLLEKIGIILYNGVVLPPKAKM